MRRLLLEAAEDEAARGVALAGDPGRSRAGTRPDFGGITAFTDLVLDAAAGRRRADRGAGRDRDRRQPDPAPPGRPHARPAGGAVRRPRRRRVRSVQRRAPRRGPGLCPGVRHRRPSAARWPHPTAASCAGPESVWSCLDGLGAHADRSRGPVGRGSAAGRAPGRRGSHARDLSTVERGTGCLPRRRQRCRCAKLFDAGVRIALGADDPLLFDSRLLASTQSARDVHGFTDAELAELARMSIRGSAAPDDVRHSLLADIDAWLSCQRRLARAPAAFNCGAKVRGCS